MEQEISGEAKDGTIFTAEDPSVARLIGLGLNADVAIGTVIMIWDRVEEELKKDIEPKE